MSEKKPVGFPDINHSTAFLATRPMMLNELPRLTRIDHEMAIIRKHHARIANAIEMFWGHKDCVEYLEQLILNGGDGFGKARVGFKHEVLSAFINLTTLHDIRQG